MSLLPQPSAPRPAASAPEAERPKMPDLGPDTEYNGELLRAVRNALGLPLNVVADRTRIGSKHLQNVEADRYDALPATVYLRGILMNLARELKLDGLKVSRSYLSLVDRARAKG
jgi:cytoskeletal protein RodZ